MKERITMNSASLQSHFPEVYREFFSKCPIVVSAPGNVFWAGEYSVMFGGLAIKQKLPLRLYIGLEPSQRKKVELGNAITIVPSKQYFEKWTVPYHSAQKTNTLIEKFLQQKGQDVNGFTYHILHEVPPGCGLASSGAFAAALSLATHLYCHLIQGKEVQKWDSISLMELTKDSQFERVFRLAWKIESNFHNQSSSGAAPFTSLVSSYLPVIYFTEKRVGDEKHHSNTRAPVNIGDNYDILDQINYYGYRFDELLQAQGLDEEAQIVKSHTDWPIDFGLIYSGDLSLSEAAIRSIRNWEWLHNELRLPWKTAFEKLDWKDGKPLFYDTISQPSERAQVPIMDALALVSLKTLFALTTVFKYGLSDEDYHFLFQSINQNQSLLNALGVTAPLVDKICFLIKEKTSKGQEIEMGVKLTGAGRYGDIFFAAPFHGLRDCIDMLVKDLRKTTNENIWLDYASWIDGFEEEGARIEQYLEEGIYSRFISEGSISLKSYTKEGAEQTELSSMEDFEKEKAGIDLLLDAIEGDVYVRGKKLTSKEIPSASMAVEILSILLANLGKSIGNDKLPESSYAQDRNEMQSKIVSPLTRVVKKYTGKTLPLKISGGLTDFRIKLEPSELDIKVLNKVF